MNQERIKYLIFILIILFLMIISFIVYIINMRFVNKKPDATNTVSNTSIDNNTVDLYTPDEVEDKEDVWEEDELNTSEQELKLQKVDDKYTYFLIKQCLTNYYNVTTKESALNLLDVEVKEKIEINENNISNLFNGFNTPKFGIDNIYKQKIDGSKNIYVVYQRLIKNSKSPSNVINTVTFVKIDEKNVDFSIYPYEYLQKNNYLNLKENDILKIDNLNEIKQNEYNGYYTDEISKENRICMAELFERFKFDLNYDIEHLYNTIDEAYKKIYFENFDEFKNYLNKKYDILNNDKITKFQANEFKNYTQFIGICDNEHNYVFSAKNLMDYTLCFDNYSTELPQYLQLYNSNLPNVQAKYCIDRFIKSINDKNYEFAYSKLLYVQKSNDFPNLNSFENYIKNNFYEKNNYEFGKLEKISNQMYQYTIKLYNNEKTESKILVATITLRENADFYIYFVLK